MFLLFRLEPLKSSAALILRQFQRSEIPLRSAALAFHTVLSIIPILGLGFWYLKRLGISGVWFEALEKLILERLNIGASAEFTKITQSLTEGVQGESWGWLGLGVLLYTVLSVIHKFGQALDTAARAEVLNEKDTWKLRLIWARRAIGLLSLPLALVMSMVLTQWIQADSFMNQVLKLKHLGPLIGRPLAWSTTTVSVFFVYYFIPAVRIRGTNALKVALIVGPLLEFLRNGLGLYARHAVSIHKIYGVFAILPLFFLWIQLSWIVLLTGALWLRPQKVNGRR